MEYLFYDFETNGLDAKNCGILQMAVMTEDEKVLFNQYTYPYDGKIDAVEIHGIDQKKLIENNAIPTYDFLKSLKECIRMQYGDDKPIYWIAYNNFGYDQIVMESHFKRMDEEVPLNWYFGDLYPLMKEHFPKLQNHKLKTVYEHIESSSDAISYHCALADTQCLTKMMKYVKTNGLEDSLHQKYMRGSFHHPTILKSPIGTIGGGGIIPILQQKGIHQVEDLYKMYLEKGEEGTKDYFAKTLRLKYGYQGMINQIQFIQQMQKIIGKRKR
jgi:DNA polymerase III epsilon subunit-like protein